MFFSFNHSRPIEGLSLASVSLISVFQFFISEPIFGQHQDDWWSLLTTSRGTNPRQSDWCFLVIFCCCRALVFRSMPHIVTFPSLSLPYHLTQALAGGLSGSKITKLIIKRSFFPGESLVVNVPIFAWKRMFTKSSSGVYGLTMWLAPCLNCETIAYKRAYCGRVSPGVPSKALLPSWLKY